MTIAAAAAPESAPDTTTTAEAVAEAPAAAVAAENAGSPVLASPLPDKPVPEAPTVVAAAVAVPASAAAPVAAPRRYGLPIAAAIALAAGLVGVGGLALRGSSSEATARLTAMEQALAGLAGDIAALKAQAEAQASQPRPAVSFGPVLSRLDSLGEAIERTQKERGAALAVAERSDKALLDKVAGLGSRLERMEKALTTASVPAVAAAAGGAQPMPPKPQEATPAKLPGYVLREVDQGIAVIEDRRGAIHEVMRGEMLPGAGRIQKIERRGGVWVAVTEKGIIAGR